MNKRIWLPITLLVLASLACSLFGRAERAIEIGKEAATRVSEAATVVGEEGVATLMPGSSEGESTAEESTAEEPAEEGTAVEELPEEEAQPELDADALAGLESYRARFEAEWKPEEGEGEAFVFEEAHTRVPSAQRLVLQGMGQDETMEIVQIEDQSWMCTAGSCSQMQADPEELASSFSEAAMFEPAGVWDEADPTLLGRETVNGVQTQHYRLNLSPMQAAFMAQGDVSDLTGEIWIADEPDLPELAVRFQMSWTEKRGEVTGQSSFSYETYDINAPFTIEPPEGAADSGLPDDVPAYPNGKQAFSMAGMTSFETSDGVSEVGEFYRESLAAEGWTIGSDDEMEGMVQQVWNKGERTLTLLVSEEEDGSSIMISIEGGS
jgi:hypothetical protein